jgi:pSer/pThr/pTyr-binding forkhead associated (FHA) protein
MDEKEFGRIVVLMKDGSEGSALALTKDVLFGRDKTADIRIKLNSVSRQHAMITIQENGQVSC